MDFDLSYQNRFDRNNRSVVLNCGEKITLPDGTQLGNFQSGLYQNIEFEGDRLIIIEIGENSEVTEAVADQCRREWSHIYKVFEVEEFKDIDVYVSPRTEKGDKMAFSLFYFGDGIPGSLHREHDFYELHTQILGRGEMQRFRENDENTLIERVLMTPGTTHEPFFDDNRSYPWHRYAAISRCILLAVESPYAIPRA